MSERRPWPLAAALIGGLLLVAVFVASQRDSSSAIELVERSESLETASAVPPASDSEQPRDVAEDTTADNDGIAIAVQTTPEPVLEPPPDLPFIDVSTVARESLSDDDFEALVARLRRDPALLSALIDEARSETDAARLNRLLRVLGEVDDPAVVALATEFVYSGDADLRTLGLDLMKRVRPGDPDVLASVSGILSTEVDGDVLVPALTALARPGNTDLGTRASLASQVAILTTHVDPAVRSTSITILSRWSNDATYTPQLISALDDREPVVRRAAAFAFVGRTDASPVVRQRLMQVASDTGGANAPRRGAILALKGMPLSDAEREEVLAIERQMDTRPIR